AVLHAVDRDAIIRGVYQNTVRATAGVVVSGVPGAVLDACGTTCTHDVGAAKALVAATFPNGGVPTVAVDYDEDPTQQKVAEAIKTNLGDAGIPAELRSHPASAYADFLGMDDKELFRFGWVAPYPAADAFLV